MFKIQLPSNKQLQEKLEKHFVLRKQCSQVTLDAQKHCM